MLNNATSHLNKNGLIKKKYFPLKIKVCKKAKNLADKMMLKYYV